MSNSFMSFNEVLYVKDMIRSESEADEDNDGDIWDDTKLNNAYDKALKIANAEVAKRVAMSTNTRTQSAKPDTKHKKDKIRVPSSKKRPEWKVGMPCRAVYDGDGLEYEAFVLKIISDKECLVRFLGYNNSEVVLLSCLKPSCGKEAWSKQIEQALAEECEEEFDEGQVKMETGSDRQCSPDGVDLQQKKKKPSKNKRNHSQTTRGFELPDPNLASIPNFMRNISMDMPLPPPPMLPPSSSRVDSEEQAVSSMLISWYMSGYYTGLYQGLKRAKEEQKH